MSIFLFGMIKDMTKGSIFPSLITFTLPIFFGNLLQNLYAVVDTFLVGRFVSLNALAAIGSTGSINFMIFALTSGLCTGFGVIISRYFGAKDEKNMKKAIAMSYILSFAFSILFTVVTTTGTKWLLTVTSTPEELFGDAFTYIFIIFLGLPLTMGYNILSTVMRSLGDSKTPLYLLLMSCILNIIGDIVLITVVHWGVFGVAIATISAQGISALSCYIYMIRKYPVLRLKKEDFRLDFKMMKQLIGLGIPSSFQYSVCSIGTMVVQTKANQLGASIVAAYSVGLRLEGLLDTFFPALGVAMTTFVAQNTGTEDYRRIRKGAGISMGICMTGSVLLYLLAHFFGYQMTTLFIMPSETEIIALVLEYLEEVTRYFVPLGLIFVFRSGSQGLGSGFIPLMSSVTELSARIIAALFFVDVMGFMGLAFSNTFSWTTGGIYCILAFYHRLRKIEKRKAATSH